jgi:hypothetical protein
MLHLHVHLNNCALSFARSQFEIKFGCERYSTSPKVSQDLIQRKILQIDGKQK